MADAQTSRISQIAECDQAAAAFVQRVPMSQLFVRDCALEAPVTQALLNQSGAFEAMSLDEAALANINDAITASSGVVETRLDILCREGLRVIAISAHPIATGTLSERLIALRDITEAVQLEQALKESNEALLAMSFGNKIDDSDGLRLALRDPLTDLPNRRAFDFALSEACSQGPFALCLLDMDQFKQVNDSLGHQTGDRLLREVAGRLKDHTRNHDFVARLGGDEFAVILSAIDDEADAKDASERLLTHFQTRVSLGDVDVRACLTGGVALGHKGADPDHIFAAADTALHNAKRNGRGTVATGHISVQRLDEHRDLAAAKILLTSSEIPLIFEPIVAEGGQVFGYEAILGAKPNGMKRDYDPILASAIKFGLGVDLVTRVIDAVVEQATRSAMPVLHLRLPHQAFEDATVVDCLAELIRNSPIEPESTFIELPLHTMEGAVAVAAERRSALNIGVILDDWELSVRAYNLARSGLVSGAKLDAAMLNPMLRTHEGRNMVAAALTTMASHGVAVFADHVNDPAAIAPLFDLGVVAAQGSAFQARRISTCPLLTVTSAA